MQRPRGSDQGPDKLLLVTIKSEFDLKLDLEHPSFRDAINYILGEDNFSSAFTRLLGLGDVAVDPQTMDRPATESPTNGWPKESIYVTVNDHRGQPITQLKRQESQAKWEKMQLARLRAQFVAMLVHEFLTRIGAKYRADLDTVSSAFRAQFISERDAAILARALHHYWDGYFDDAARIALPSIEAVIRSVVQATHGSSYIEPKPGRDGRESTLGRLIEMLDPNLPESFRWDLAVILTDPLGLNLRNVHLHGLAEVGPKYEAAIILYTAARLTLIHTSGKKSKPS